MIEYRLRRRCSNMKAGLGPSSWEPLRLRSQAGYVCMYVCLDRALAQFPLWWCQLNGVQSSYGNDFETMEASSIAVYSANNAVLTPCVFGYNGGIHPEFDKLLVKLFARAPAQHVFEFPDDTRDALHHALFHQEPTASVPEPAGGNGTAMVEHRSNA